MRTSDPAIVVLLSLMHPPGTVNSLWMTSLVVGRSGVTTAGGHVLCKTASAAADSKTATTLSKMMAVRIGHTLHDVRWRAHRGWGRPKRVRSVSSTGPLYKSFQEALASDSPQSVGGPPLANFGVKLMRPGFDPAAELPVVSPASRRHGSCSSRLGSMNVIRGNCRAAQASARGTGRTAYTKDVKPDPEPPC